MEPVGARLRRLRVAAGMSQTQLAGEDLSTSYISLIEAGKREPSSRVLVQLAERLQCSPRLLREGLDDQQHAAVELEVAWAELALASGDAAEARRRTEGLLEQTVGDRAGWRVRLTNALAAERLGDLEAAARVLEELRQLASAQPEQWPLLPVAIALCRCYREAGDAAYSIDVAQDALAIAERAGLAGTDEHAELRASLVAAYYHRGDLLKAGQLVEELQRDVEQRGSSRARAAAYWNASVVAHERGATGEALHMAERASVLLSEADQARNQARLQLLCAGLMLRLDAPDAATARSILCGLLDRLGEAGSVVDLAYARTELARAELQLDDPIAAVEHASAALALLGSEPRLEKAEAFLVLAQARRAQGNLPEAAALARQAAQLLSLSPNGREAALAWNELADLLTELDEPEEAIRAYRQAMAAVGLQQLRADYLTRAGAAPPGRGVD